MRSTIILIPRLAGTRPYAAQIVVDAKIPVESSVILDFSECRTLHTDFCDEIVKQIGLYKNSRILKIIGGKDSQAQELISRSLRLRHLDPLSE